MRTQKLQTGTEGSEGTLVGRPGRQGADGHTGKKAEVPQSAGLFLQGSGLNEWVMGVLGFLCL